MISSVWINNTIAVEPVDRGASSVWINSTASRPVGYLSKSRSRRTSRLLSAEVISPAFSAKWGVTSYYIRHIESRNLILNFAELAALSSGSRTQRPRRVPSSAAVARFRSQPRTQRNTHIFYSPAELGRRVGTPRIQPKDVVSS